MTSAARCLFTAAAWASRRRRHGPRDGGGTDLRRGLTDGADPGACHAATRPGGNRLRAGILFYPTVLSTTHNTACGIRHLGNVHQVSGLDLTLGRQRAMLRSNRESHSGVHLTSSVTFGYTASLRCTLTSSVSPSRLRGFAAGRLACVR